jgi:histidine triad (HIT) family protein
MNDVEGHTIVIPKKHVNNIFDCDVNTLTNLMNTVKLISNHYVDNCGYQGINLLNANGVAAQQSVPHFHIHMIPRKNNDGIDAWPVFKGTNQSADEMLQKLKINV